MIVRSAVCAIVLAAALAAQLPKQTPAGLLLSEGATLTRAPRGPAAAKSGEILLPGDRLRASTAVTLLDCGTRRILKFHANTEFAVSDSGIQSTSGPAPVVERFVSACFLPSVRRTPVAGPLHLGATTMRGETGAAADGGLHARINALPGPTRDRVVAGLKQIEGDDGIAWVSRAALLESVGLLADATAYYEKALAQLPSAFWIQTKIQELADARDRAAK